VNLLLDGNDLLKAIKKAALEAVETTQPSDFCFGEVVSVEPLKITVEPKMTLGTAQLVLTRNVTDFVCELTIDWKTEGELGDHNHSVDITTSADGYHVHSHTVSGDTKNVNLEHSHKIMGRKKVTIHNALQVGDGVVLMKQKGGQKYLVLDKVVKA
jgi:hypothetical protein